MVRRWRDVANDAEWLKWRARHEGHALYGHAPTLGTLASAFGESLKRASRTSSFVAVAEMGTGRGVRDADEHWHAHVLAVGHQCHVEYYLMHWRELVGNAWGGQWYRVESAAALEALGRYEAKHTGKQALTATGGGVLFMPGADVVVRGQYGRAKRPRRPGRAKLALEGDT